MQYTKPMIELVYEIRRRAPSELKPGINLANPELFDELNAFYRGKQANTVVKALIKELFNFAGERWHNSLVKGEMIEEKFHTKHYRGAISLDEKPATQACEAKAKKRLIYRGQVVA